MTQKVHNDVEFYCHSLALSPVVHRERITPAHETCPLPGLSTNLLNTMEYKWGYLKTISMITYLWAPLQKEEALLPLCHHHCCCLPSSPPSASSPLINSICLSQLWFITWSVMVAFWYFWWLDPRESSHHTGFWNTGWVCCWSHPLLSLCNGTHK